MKPLSFEDFEREEEKAREAFEKLSQEEKDQQYLGSMILSLRHYTNIKGQLDSLRKKIEAAPGYAEPESFVEFSTPDSVFALEYPCRIKWKDHTFYSAEHAIHYEKALHFVDRKTARAILESDQLEDCRNLSRKVKNFYSPALEQIWTGLLYKINQEKFDQAEPFRQALLDTAGKTLYHFNPVDHFLTITEVDEYEPDDPDWYQWILQPNILGIILTYLRVHRSGKY